MAEREKLMQALHFRHACKIFDKEKKIADEMFETILEAGRLSPSSFGFEPWKFLVIQNRALREKLREVTWGAQDTLPTASHFVVLLARRAKEMLAESDYVTHMMYDVHHLPKEAAEARREKYGTFQREDFKLLESERTTFDWAAKQGYIALANMMTTAAMLGIDSCPIEGFQLEKAEEILYESCGIDRELFGLSVMVAFGYRLHTPRPKTRQSLDEIVQWCP